MDTFFCKKCDYKTINKQSWKRHLNSKKHKNSSFKKCAECGKIITSKSSFYRHLKTCSNIYEELEKKDKKIEHLENLMIHNNEKLTHMVEKVLDNQNVIKSQKGNTINNLSINVFLNEQCKNAMNLKDFMNQVRISLEDLLYTKNHGYIAGISNIFIKNLKDIEPKERPIHCSSIENQQFYVKDENKWDEDDKNKKMNQSIKLLSRKQMELTKDWLRSHPNFIDNPSELEEYHQMIANICANGEPEDINNCIMKNVGECVNVEEIDD
jgi:hypothetical protein